MSGSVNKVILIGNLGKDPEIRHTKDGKPIASFSIATSEKWTDKNTGEKKESTDWHNIVVFNEGLAGVVQKYVKKGSKVYVEGQLKTRKWTDKEGHERYTTEVILQGFDAKMVMVGGSEGSGNRPTPNLGDNGAQSGYGVSSHTYPYQDSHIDDTIPF
ncbi:MAG: single-stranded DNA-binding protein [Shewanella oncorhynchi]